MNRKNNEINKRARRLKNGRRGLGPVIYWMSREQRVNDNWALLWAQQEAVTRQKGLWVIFCHLTKTPEANLRQSYFMLQGLLELSTHLTRSNITFKILQGEASLILPKLAKTVDAHLLITDFSPLRRHRRWIKSLQENVVPPIYEVDSHNIVPAWVASNKKEYGAYTLRPKIHRILKDYLSNIPAVTRHPYIYHHDGPDHELGPLTAIQNLILKIKEHVPEKLGWIVPGEKEAIRRAKNFVEQKLSHYNQTRNNPCLLGQSNLSPYLHFGHLSPQRLAWLVDCSEVAEEDKQTFLEELVVRRELADNFCFFEANYDSFDGFPDWARKSLSRHRKDKRQHLYNLRQFDQGLTHSQLWNSCQKDLVQIGKLHGYLRMYWAKKILEWTAEPEEAMAYAIELNDRYSLDGNDPNGYTGIAWSIGGVHDRAWKERSIYGKVRYMNENGCRRKFDVDKYIDRSSKPI